MAVAALPSPHPAQKNAPQGADAPAMAHLQVSRKGRKAGRSNGRRVPNQTNTETILERINALGVEVREGFARVEGRFEALDVRVARVESVVNATRSEMLTLRADFKELRAALREHFPAVK